MKLSHAVWAGSLMFAVLGAVCAVFLVSQLQVHAAVIVDPDETDTLADQINDLVTCRLLQMGPPVSRAVDQDEAAECGVSLPPPPPSPIASLTVAKAVIGGTSTSADFLIHVKRGAREVSGSPQAGTLTGTTYDGLDADTYTISESGGPSNYTASFSGSCGSDGAVALASSTIAICILTNTFQAPAPSTGSLTVAKIVVGGTAHPSDFQIHAKNGSNEVSGSPQAGTAAGTTYTGLTPAAYAVSESGGPSNYAASFSGNCDSSGAVSIASSTIAICTITNTFHAPGDGGGTPHTGTLVIKKVFANGTTTPSMFSFSVNGASSTAFMASGENDLTVATGTYSVVEVASSTYAPSYSNCSEIIITTGATSTCTITNRLAGGGGGDHGGSATSTASLKVVKVMNGGSATSSDFQLHVKTGGAEITGSPRAGSATGTVYMSLSASSTYTVSETGSPANYTGAFSGDCDQSGVVSLHANATSTCTITNIFSQPGPTGGGGPSTGSGSPPSGGGGSNGPIIGSFGGGSGSPLPTVTTGRVLGVATSTAPAPHSVNTSCSAYLSSYLRMGKKNDSAEVRKLQTFLNKHGEHLPVTGFFGRLTLAAVNRFQLKNAEQILAPWVGHGLPNAQTATGYVYITTQRLINLMECQGLNIPIPSLP